jgi:cardiolipin synthase
MKARDIPNIITVFRFLLVPPVVVLLLKQQFGSALVVFGVAGFSDALDGYLAKQYGWTSRLGGLMDPLADKLLLLACFITLGWLGLIPWWLVVLVIVRDLVIMTGAIVYHFLIERLDAAPSPISKLNTFAQILLVLAIMFAEGVRALPALWLEVLMYGVLVTTVWSGLGYVLTWSRRAWQRRGA